LTVDYKAAAARVKLLAHPERLRLLDALRRERETVRHLMGLLDKPQPYVSQQLRILRQRGVINAEKEGLHVYYRLADEAIGVWLDEILGEVTAETAPPAGYRRLSDCPCPKCSTGREPAYVDDPAYDEVLALFAPD
jgi:DNA-binding transcriptional ArsR family regulator